jgi:predicted RNA binding protein YcfA (HicA-like mRNA interferase family)
MKVPVLKPRDLIKVLEKLNCFKKRQTGSHLIFYCPKQKKIIPVPIHPKDLKKGLVLSIRRELDLSIQDFLKLLKDC